MSKRRIALLGVPLSLAWIAGCERNQPANTASPDKTVASSPTGGLNPIENYKQQRMADAMRGLRYEAGVVTLDAAEAPQVAAELSGETFESLLAAGREQMGSSLHVEAIGSFTRAVILDPAQAEGLEALGDALITKGRITESQAAYASARAIDDTSIALRFKVAGNLQRQGDLDGQIAALQSVLDLDAAHAEAHARLAMAYYYKNDVESARSYLADAERLGAAVPPQFKALLAQK
ncbi:MAG: hypothetical protein IT449_09800 [Phycisphaerales bacterium]|nr:hypothetical protein [Phycisphaerales bacterium]